MWNIKKHTKKENETYINARADEWTSLPIYATEIIVPPLMYFIKWYYIIIAVFVLNIVWGFFNRKFISIRISHILWEINKVRWIVFIYFWWILYIRNNVRRSCFKFYLAFYFPSSRFAKLH